MCLLILQVQICIYLDVLVGYWIGFREVKVLASIKVIVNGWVCAKGYILAHYCRLC